MAAKNEVMEFVFVAIRWQLKIWKQLRRTFTTLLENCF